LYVLLVLASAVFLGSESLGTSLFVASYDSQGHGGGILFSYKHSAQTPRKTPSLLLMTSPLSSHGLIRGNVFTEPVSKGGLHNPVVPPLLGADDIENTASFIVVCWTVFTGLLLGNALINLLRYCVKYGFRPT
jgi:hypothetical protein